MRLVRLSVCVLSLAAFFSTVPVSVSAACAGDKTETGIPPDPTAGIPLGGGTPSANAVPLFWTLPFQTGKMDKGVANGGLGGLEGADFFCNRVAGDSTNFPLTTTLVRQRAGLFKAILSNRLTDAISRFDDMAGDKPGAPEGAIVHDVVDSTGKCIASGVDDLFFSGYNFASSLPDNEGTIAALGGVGSNIDFWTGSKDDGTKYHNPAGGLTDTQINNLYCSSSTSPTDKGWTSESGLLNGAIGTINDASFNSSSKWLGTGTTKGCVNGIHLLCLQAAPTPTQPGGSGDPQFVGLQGQSFQVHGMPDEYFNLISSPDMQLNSRFTYLASGRCNYNNTECWTHPGTYIDQLGFMFPGLTIKAIAGSHQDGMTVYVNEKRLNTNTGSTHHTIHSQQHQHHHDINATQIITITYTQHDQLVVASPLFTITATNSDMFFNFGVSLHSPSLLSAGSALRHVSDKSGSSVYPSFPLHGLLGQTWKNARYQHGRMFAGTVDDYMLLDSKILSTKFIYNQYKH